VKNGYMAEAYGIVEGFIHHTNFKGRPSPGQTFRASILEVNRKARKLVFTRRDIMQKEEQEALERDYGQLLEGMVVEGVVERLSPYGAFIKITNTVTGLLHISEFSYEHVKKPSEVLKPGDVVPVKILTIDREKNKVSLSRKAAMKDPLMLMLPGEEMDGVIESVADFGVFVRLENGVTGLVHVSELSHKRFGHPSEIVQAGQTLRVKVLRVQPEDRRVSLSAKANERDPWSDVYSHFTNGQQVTGPVTQVLQSGVVMELEGGFEAFVPISEMSEDRIKHPSDLHKEGDELTGFVLSIDSAKRRIRVSLLRAVEDSGRPSSSMGRSSEPMISDIRPTAGKFTLGDILAGKLDLTNATKRDKAEEPVAAKASAPVEVPPAEPEVEVSAAVEEEPVVVEESVAEETAAQQEPTVEDEPAAKEETAAEEEPADDVAAEEVTGAVDQESTESNATVATDVVGESSGEDSDAVAPDSQ
ncbi:MAG: S1 RNA-binding domain-containing protein, partial [bacterium]|nr:S1 RNA-binding domain-containing protein [bacterium]